MLKSGKYYDLIRKMFKKKEESLTETGLCRVCPVAQFMMQFYLDKILKKRVLGVGKVIYIMNYD